LLFEGVDEKDDAKVEEATCLLEAIRTHMEREEALGLIDDAEDPILVDERRGEVRDLVYTFVERLSQRGRRLLAVSAARVLLFGDGEPGLESQVDQQGDNQPITASGIVGLRVQGMPREADVHVYRLGDRWCLNPLSMQ